MVWCARHSYGFCRLLCSGSKGPHNTSQPPKRSVRRASVQDMTTDGSSGAQQLQPGLRQVAGRQQNPAGAAGTASQPAGQPHTAAGVGAIAFTSAGTLDKPTLTAAEQQPGAQCCTDVLARVHVHVHVISSSLHKMSALLKLMGGVAGAYLGCMRDDATVMHKLPVACEEGIHPVHSTPGSVMPMSACRAAERKRPVRTAREWRPLPLLCKRLDVMDPYRGKKAPLEVAAPKQVTLAFSHSPALLPSMIYRGKQTSCWGFQPRLGEECG